MPLHIDSVRRNIIQTFSDEEENSFSKTQKEFLRQLLNLENVDYQVESTNLFDLKKYLDILNNRHLEHADYNSLGVFMTNKFRMVLSQKHKLQVGWLRTTSGSPKFHVMNS
jgi:hypothetical protein